MSSSLSYSYFTGFSEADKQRGLHRAGSQCELESPVGTRCTAEAEKCVPCMRYLVNGQPLIDYLVAVCPEHFKRHRKGIPFIRAVMLVKRRVSYFPEGESTGPVFTDSGSAS